jgi:Uma2 family endonuclease
MPPELKQKLTFEQYLLTPYDGRRTEFVNGEIIEVAPPTGRHLDIVSKPTFAPINQTG